MSAAPTPPDEETWRRWGVEPSWSRWLDVDDRGGGSHRWHVLDTGPPAFDGGATIVCVHGNPTWSYAWKDFLTRLAGRHRVIAVDQLSMGYSERTGPRRYAKRVTDLDDVVAALDIDPLTPLVLAAHDWGGAIAMGWAVDHPERVGAMVLCNTGIAVPDGRRAPGIIRLAASAPLRDLVCRRTPAFVEGTVRLSGSRLSAVDREAFRAPYRRAANRGAIETFVGDIPLTPEHPSAASLEAVAARLGELDVPVLLAWGVRDIVFDDDFAADLAGRLPNTRLHRFVEANHLVMAEADVAGVADTWLADVLSSRAEPPGGAGDADGRGGGHDIGRVGGRHDGRGASPPESILSGLERRRESGDIAVADLASGDTIDFRSFVSRVDRVAAVLAERGLQPGDRVAMLTPPGIDLIVAVYAVWRAGGVTVIADRGLGLRGLGAAVSSARPAFSIGPRAARVASALMRWAPRATHLDVAALMREAEGMSDARPSTSDPDPDDEVAILFTSGATGPAKGVRYLHRQLAAQRDALMTTYGVSDDDRLVAAFAPFALYGPAFGVPTAIPDSDVTKPGKLTARVLDDACLAVSATMVFASPAALSNVVSSAAEGGSFRGLEALGLLLSAGAPVPSETLHAVAELAPEASLHTPYGMTEVLPVASIDLAGIDAAEAGEDPVGGVCVGRAVAGGEIRIAPLHFDALADTIEAVDSGGTGEILVRAPWVSDGYLGRWQTERLARPGDGWHRTGDVGHLDGEGRLWVEGRIVHVIDTVDGAVTSVPLERAVERALVPVSKATAGRVAAVGVGPPGCQQIVVVLEGPGDDLADAGTSAAVRAAVSVPVAAVLTMSGLPVDIRHNAKIDRVAVAGRASALLAGGRGRGRRR